MSGLTHSSMRAARDAEDNRLLENGEIDLLLAGWVETIDSRCVRGVRDDAAAGELRARIRARLLELERPDLARDLDGAWISTIHGFCRRLLTAYPLAAGIDPAGVATSVWEALTGLLGRDARGLAGVHPTAISAPAMYRDADSATDLPEGAFAMSLLARPAPEPDEADRLFGVTSAD